MASLGERAAEQRGAGGGPAMALDRPWVAGPSSSVGARGRATTEGEVRCTGHGRGHGVSREKRCDQAAA